MRNSTAAAQVERAPEEIAEARRVAIALRPMPGIMAAALDHSEALVAEKARLRESGS